MCARYGGRFWTLRTGAHRGADYVPCLIERRVYAACSTNERVSAAIALRARSSSRS